MFQRTYLYCGKTYGDVCEYNNECSSDYCSRENLCCYNYYVPSESTTFQQDIETMILYAIIVFLFLVLCCVCTCIYIRKHKQKTKKLEINKD